MKKRLIFFSLILFSFITLFYTNKSFSKYSIEQNLSVANINIDNIRPKIDLLSVKNTNENYETYANKNHIVTIQIKITEKNIFINNFNKESLQFYVGNSLIFPTFNSFDLISEATNYKIYEFSITNITGDGSLKIVVPRGTVIDTSEQQNMKKNFFPEIIIDNTPPSFTFEEVSTIENKSNAYIYSSESIKTIDGWNFSTNNKTLTNTFYNPVYYPITLEDYAGNSSEIYVDIKNASNINLNYASYDKSSNFSIVSAGEIAGKKTLNSSSICKTEAIFVKASNNINSDILQARCYLHTHWKDSLKGLCSYSENYYYCGYNPQSPQDWINIGNNNLSIINSVYYSELGGIGINDANKKINGGEKIPPSIAEQYLYGISSVSFKLNEKYSNLSVVYQTYVKNVGWLSTLFDGEELKYSLNRPISAIRINIVPKSEKERLINFWNKDIGTNNIN